MDVKIGGRRYFIVIGTSAGHGETWSFIEMDTLRWWGRLDTVLSAERRNATGQVTVRVHGKDVPPEVVAYFERLVEEEFARWPG
jgi:hypothetical protein